MPPILVQVSLYIISQRPWLHSRLSHEEDDVHRRLRGILWYVRSSHSASDDRKVRLLASCLNALQSLISTAHAAVKVWRHCIMHVCRPWRCRNVIAELSVCKSCFAVPWHFGEYAGPA
jgi:hypothetical protein